MSEKTWIIRTVRRGRVRVYGAEYRPETRFLAYDGRLDGQRFAFARYRSYPDVSGKPAYLPFLALWGTEAAYRDGSTDWGPELVDGAFPWLHWQKVEEEATL